MFHIVLFEPQIPSNTGNVARTCVAFEAALHLIHPLGFKIDNKHLQRAGLDYWPHLQLDQHSNFNSWWQGIRSKRRVFFFSSKVRRPYTQNKFQKGDSLVFGSETHGLPEHVFIEQGEQMLNIPFSGPVRCLNLSNAVSIALSEAVRQVRGP